MVIEELIRLIEEKPYTEENHKAFIERNAEREKAFRDTYQPITNEWLNKEYLI